MLQGNYNYSQDRSFLTENEENPALVLSNVHNNTSARDGPIFGYKGPSMNTSSLDIPCMFTVLAVKKGYTLHLHTACDINGYTLTSTILVGERKTPPHPHC
jgi:hypothetical protein